MRDEACAGLEGRWRAAKSCPALPQSDSLQSVSIDLHSYCLLPHKQVYTKQKLKSKYYRRWSLHEVIKKPTGVGGVDDAGVLVQPMHSFVFPVHHARITLLWTPPARVHCMCQCAEFKLHIHSVWKCLREGTKRYVVDYMPDFMESMSQALVGWSAIAKSDQQGGDFLE